MFDDLHDSDPPVADTHAFAAIAERAQAMRRRRAAAAGTVSAVAFIAAGAVVIGSVSGDDDQRLATFDAAAPPPTTAITDSSNVSTTAPVAPVVDSSIATAPTTTTTTLPATTADAGTTVPDTTTTSMLDTAAPVPTGPAAVAVVGDPQPLECGGFRVCTYDHLADGRLVQIGNDGSESGPPTFTVFDQSGATVAATGMLGNFDASGAFLVDVGPGDIAYVWYTRREESETAHMGAFELTGREAGRQIIEFDAVVDFSGDTEQVATTAGFVEVGCCDGDPVRPAPDAEVVFPWVDRDGNPITNAIDTFFRIEIDGQDLTVVATSVDGSMSWTIPDLEATPRGMPMLHQLDDGRVLLLLEQLHGAGASVSPAYLNPDGTIEIGPSPGSISHILPDGRAALQNLDTGTYALATLADPASAEEPGDAEPTPTTTTTVPPSPTQIPEHPLIAITGDGDAIFFDGADANPTLIFDGPVDAGSNTVRRVASSESEQRLVVGRCCAQGVGFVTTVAADDLPMSADSAPPDDQVGESEVVFDGFGRAPALDEDGNVQALITGDGKFVFITDADIDTFANINVPAQAGEIVDLVWSDDAVILALGRFENVWTLTAIRYSSSVAAEVESAESPSPLTIESSRDFASTANFADLVFAGEAVDGEIAMHDRGTDQVLSGTIDDYGNNNGDERGSSLQVITLPGPARSAWYFDPGQLIRVDTEGVLRVGDRVIPGEYTWARR